ncbi:hypothetical protein F4805DRAFT_118030 [Annulohypoxylon moriforme]|nr:hypothetical protein F4805DRAFT_118030 [Annulohypoxylon moriforme]
MDQIIFDTNTYSHWRDQDGWDWVDTAAFIDHLNRPVRPQADDAGLFRLKLVILESRGDQAISITQDHFRSLLQRFEIPESALEPLSCKDGQHTHSVEYSRVGAETYPSSLCISIQTPSLEFDKNTSSSLDSFSVLLRISVQRHSAACIIIARNHLEPDRLEATPTAGARIATALHHNYDLIRRCPFQVMNILFEQLDGLNERYWIDRERAFFKLRSEMDSFCRRPKELYDDDGMAVFGVIHGMNILRRKLIPLKYALGFELSALRYTRNLMEVYTNMQKDGNGPRFSQAMLGKFNQKIEYLETAATLRQQRREGLDEWAQLNVNILRSSNAQHDTKLTLDDSIAVKMISFVTLIFLPVSLVATISGSNAFAVENNSIGNGVKVWNNWWILLIITVGLTVLVLGSGLLYWVSRRYNARHFTDMNHGKGKGKCPFSRIGEMKT